MRDAGVIHFGKEDSATTLSATGDKKTWTALEDLNVFEVGVVVTTAITGGSDALIVKFDKRPKAGSDTNRGDGDVASCTVNTSVNVAGDTIRKFVSVQVKKGEQIVAEVTDAAAAGAGVLFLKAYPSGQAKVSSHSDGGTVTLTDRDFDA